jgi:hypothetical protein
MELLVLLELNSPDRYHGEEAITLADGSTAAALGQMPGGLDRQLVGDLPGSCSSNPAAVEAEARAVASAAAAAEVWALGAQPHATGLPPIPGYPACPHLQCWVKLGPASLSS